MDRNSHSRTILIVLALMVLPFTLALASKSLIAQLPGRMQQIVFVLVLVVSAAGQFEALSRLAEDRDWSPNWKLLTYALKVIALVCLLFFTASAVIAGYRLFRPAHRRAATNAPHAFAYLPRQSSGIIPAEFRVLR